MASKQLELEEENKIREKVQKIRKGKTFKTYKEMCEFFDVKVKSGSSKKAQIKMFEHFLEFERNGNQFKVLKVNKNAPPFTNGRSDGNNKIYSHFIEILLLNLLSEKNNNVIESTKNKLYNDLNMVNDNYLDYYKNPDTHQNNLEGVATFDIEQFYQRASSKLSSILESALKSLQRKFLILYSKSTVLVTKIYNENGTSYVEERRGCNDKEEEIVLKLKRDTLLEMGYTNSWQLTPATYKVFYKKLNKKLHEEFNCTYGYAQLKIIYNQEHVVQAIPMEEELLNKRLLNEATKAGILKTTMNEFDKLQSKDRNMLIPAELKKEIIMKLDEEREEFKELQDMLINYFINSEQKAI